MKKENNQIAFGQKAVAVFQELEKRFSLETIVKNALEDSEYSDLLELTIKY
jgi:hypothetical protein